MNTNHTQIEVSTRVGLPDLIKGIAVILMIQVHLMELFATTHIYQGLLGKISLFLGGPPAAPVFMAVMGYFIAGSKKTFSAHLWRGLKLILLGLLLNIGMNFNLLLNIYKGTFELNPLHYLFGVDILFLAGLSIILIALLKLIYDEKLPAWLLTVLLVGSLNRFLPAYSGENEVMRYLLACFYGFSPWSYFPVFPWLAYVLIGFTFRLIIKKNLIPEVSSSLRKYFFVALLIVLIFTFHFGFRISTILNVYYHHDLIFVMWTMAFLALWFILFDGLYSFFETNKVFIYLRWVGKNVTVFYFVQWLIIGNIATEVYKSQPVIQLILWFVAMLAITSAFVWGLKQIKLIS